MLLERILAPKLAIAQFEPKIGRDRHFRSYIYFSKTFFKYQTNDTYFVAILHVIYILA